jgi:hypothetical protein
MTSCASHIECAPALVIDMRAESQLIRAYLLGQLDEADYDSVETRLFADDAFLARLELAEDELVEGYVRGEIGGGDRRCFEQHFLQSPRRQQLTTLAAAMWRTWGQEPAQPAAPWSGRLGGWLPLSWRNPWLALAVASLLVLATSTVWLGTTLREERRVVASRERADVEEHRKTQSELERIAQELRNRPPTAVSAPSSSIAPSRDARVDPFVAVVLAPGVFRGREPKALTIPRDAAMVRMRLETGARPAGGIQEVIVRQTTGKAQEVWRTRWSTADGARADSHADIFIPAALLPSGHYIIEWSVDTGSGPQPVDDYAVIVRRP